MKRRRYARHPDPADLTRDTRDPQAPANPGLALRQLLHAAEGLSIAAWRLRNEPASATHAQAEEHLQRAQEHLRLAEAELRQCLHVWCLPDGPPPLSAVTPEMQDVIDAALARLLTLPTPATPSCAPGCWSTTTHASSSASSRSTSSSPSGASTGDSGHLRC